MRGPDGFATCLEREDDFAHMVGAPGACDYGPERCSWMTRHLTNWIGDDGFLHRSATKIRRHNPVGDTLFINGEVTGKHEDGEHGCIEIRQEGLNQDGELSIHGTAAVRLRPSPPSGVIRP